MTMFIVIPHHKYHAIHNKTYMLYNITGNSNLALFAYYFGTIIVVN